MTPLQALIDEAYDRLEAMATDTHDSIAASIREQEQPLSLAQCMQVFTHDEKLTAHCSNCSVVNDDVIERPQVCGEWA